MHATVSTAAAFGEKGTRKRAAMQDVSNRHHAPAQSGVVAAGVKKAVGVKVAVPPQGLRAKSEQPLAALVEKRKAVRPTKLQKQREAIKEDEPPYKRGKSETASTPAAEAEAEASTAVAAATSSTLPQAAALSDPFAAPISPRAQPVQLWDDLDAEDADDPLMVSEYVSEIFTYLRSQELRLMPASDYMERQEDITWRMRGILIDWLIEVHQKFRLLPETLFLAINIVDRFLTQRVCSMGKLQLVGITALFIASKYEEVMCPSVQNFIYMADGGYSDGEILKAEQYVLQILDFNLAFPNPMNFLRRISKADSYDIQARTVAKYLLEVSLVEHQFLAFPPSLASAASMYLARAMLGRGEWDHNLQHYSGYTETQVMDCVHLMLEYLMESTPKHDALFKKYASKKFIKASLYVREWCKKPQNTDPILDLPGDGAWVIQDPCAD
jgi:G2/mitotic-specific cyclin 1/2